MKVYKVEMMVLDLHNGYDEQDVIYELESNDYLYVAVTNTESREIEWCDKHPLNFKSTQKEEFNRLFSQ